MPSPTSLEALARADRRELLRMVDEAFEEAAARAGGVIEKRFSISGQVVALRFAGDALVAPITRALAHLRAMADAPPALRLHVWDGESTGRPLPLLAASLVRLLRLTWLEDRGVRGEILAYCDPTMRAALEGHDTDVLSLLDVERGLGVFWTPDWRTLPWYEAGAPLRTLLSWWFETQGRHLVHGGGVGLPSGGVLLAGRGGSGKSTAALACLGSAFRYAGDDYSLVHVEDGGDPELYGLYNTAKVKSRDDLARFPWIATHVVNADRLESGEQKPMLFLHECRPDVLIDRFPLKAIVLPRFIPDLDAPKVVPVASSSALKVLAESTITQRTGSGGVTLQVLSRLTRQVPCFLLGTTCDLGRIAPALTDLLREL